MTVRQTTSGEFKDQAAREISQLHGVRRLSDIEKAWLAGVIDGEGSIFISKISPKKSRYRRGFFYRPELTVANCNSSFLNKVREIIGKGFLGMDKEKNPRWKDKWQYRGSGLVLRGILPQILPNLVVKREVAERMLEYLAFIDAYPINRTKRVPAGYDEKLDSIYWTIKRLNERGGRSVSDTDTHDVNATQEGPQSRNRMRGRPTGHRASARVMNEPDRAWLAGVIDGEGSIFLSKVSGAIYRRGFFYRPQLAVSNTNRIFLLKLKELVREGTVQLSMKGENGWKTRWEYCAVAGVLRSILPQILPYMVAKRAIAEKMLEYFRFIDANPIYGFKMVPEGYYERLDRIYWAIKKLNKKGRTAVSGR